MPGLNAVPDSSAAAFGLDVPGKSGSGDRGPSMVETIWARLSATRLTGLFLVGPALVFLDLCFVWPVLSMIGSSLSAHSVDGVMIEGFTVENYVRLFSTDLTCAFCGARSRWRSSPASAPRSPPIGSPSP